MTGKELTLKTRYFPVCLDSELYNLGSREFVMYQMGRPYFGFIVKKDDQIFAYANTCPHQGRMLQWKPDTFLTRDRSRIMCAAHGATFEIESGLCIGGPCLGQRLTTLKSTLVSGVVMLMLEQE